MALEPKKMALIRIMQILEEHSDADHPLRQEEIVDRLERDYGIALERKAVGRNLSLLAEAVPEIESDHRGCYLASRKFDDAELRLLIDGVLASRYISAGHSRDLIERLCSLSNKYFRSHVKNVFSVDQWSKTDNCALFYNIAIIDEAIERGRQVVFHYNKYGTDKKLHKTSEQQVSPYQLILHNQRYYLICCAERWKTLAHYRLDHITDIRMTNEPATPLRSLPGHEKGIDYRDYATALPYMFTDRPISVTFLADRSVIDQVVDWFGKDAVIKEDGEQVEVRVRVSLNAMEYWAMQYLNHVEIVTPVSLRERIATNLKTALEKYR